MKVVGRLPAKYLRGLMLVVSFGVFLNWLENVSWKIELGNPSIVTVTGTATSRERTKIANFSVGVTAYNDDKEKATSEVNTKVEKIISDVKAFGVAEEDIQTQNVSVNENQVEIMLYPRRDVPGKWMATNSVAIILRDVDKASALAELLNKTGATNVYGPSFGFENVESMADELLPDAMADAHTKAEALATASGKKVGDVVSVVEGYSSYPYPLKAAGLGSADSASSVPVEPGSELLTKTVTVVYKLK